MRTIRLNGSGPFSGQVFYGEMVALERNDHGVFVCISLDDRRMGDAFINPKTGALMDGEGGETDLLIVDLHDMPILDEFFVLNGDAPISQAA